MGVTISITIPKPLEKILRREAKKAGMARSRFIGNILLNWQSNQENLEKAPNDCDNREDDGMCTVFDMICNASQVEANSCSGYHKGEKA